MHYVESLLKVLVVGLVLGAGLPAVFALGLRAVTRRNPYSIRFEASAPASVMILCANAREAST